MAPFWNRRTFLKSAASTLLAASSFSASAAERPPVLDPRATSGDSAIEPAWDERLSITVGHDNADINGATEKAIQAAVDYLARAGGGTVNVLPGVYHLRNAIYLQSGIRLVGAGNDTVLLKEPSNQSALVLNSDWYDQEITLANARGFEVGDGVCIPAKNPHTGGSTIIKRTLVARSGNRFKLDKALREHIWLEGEPTVETLFPIVTGEFIENIAVENIVLDGNKSVNANLDGNYAGGIFLQDCRNLVFRGVTSRNYNGDGFSWQICHDVLAENCNSHDNEQLGFHPGSGSQRPVLRNNVSQRNWIGIFFCWGVKYGLAEGNTIADSRDWGISIGHNDTDNLIINNKILRSGTNGILFRDESEAFTGNRNTLRENEIVDSGPDTGIAIDIQGPTADILFERNAVRETRGPAQRVGIRIGKHARNIALTENTISGVATDLVDLRQA